MIARNGRPTSSEAPKPFCSRRGTRHASGANSASAPTLVATGDPVNGMAATTAEHRAANARVPGLCARAAIAVIAVIRNAITRSMLT